ncbi:MAG: hypothetical protein K2J39_12125 [Ruminococcus sp.]|nr:hypothetical protein [Ruminococcus sp.]
MTKSKVYFILLILLDVVSIVIAYGSIIEVDGVIAYFVFLLLIALNVISVRKYKKVFQKIILSVMVFVYIITGIIYMIRSGSRSIYSQEKDGHYIYTTYEVNPGAMGHISYMDNIYYSLIDTDGFFSVRIVKNTRHHRYIG